MGRTSIFRRWGDERRARRASGCASRFHGRGGYAKVELMSVVAKEKLSADQFLVWAEAQEGRWELHDGAAVAMSPERVAHAETKDQSVKALARAIESARAPCRALPDGLGVRINQRTIFEPDALVYCGPRLPPEAIEVPNPIIVVEVLSPRTAARDHGAKMTRLFLAAWPPPLSHHRPRTAGADSSQARARRHHRNADSHRRSAAPRSARHRDAGRRHVRARMIQRERRQHVRP